MNLNQINEFLVPYNITISCENCNTMKKLPKLINATSKRTMIKPRSKYNLKSNDVANKTPNKQKPKVESKQPSKKAVNIISTRNVFKGNKIKFMTSKKIVQPANINHCFHPPNNILNLNRQQNELINKLNFQEMFEVNRNTPNKIDDIEFDRFFHSERKENTLSNILTNSTTNGVVINPSDLIFFSKDKFKKRSFDSPYCERLTFFAIPSRDLSPIHTSYHQNISSPSKRELTPNNYIDFTPNVKYIDRPDEHESPHFNLLENMYFKKL